MAHVIASVVISMLITFVINRIEQRLSKQKEQPEPGPKLDDVMAQTAGFGVPIRRMYGTTILGGNIIWNTPVAAAEMKGDANNFDYYISMAIAYCSGPVNGIQRIFVDGKVRDLKEICETYEIFLGTEVQTPSQIIIDAMTRPASGSVPYGQPAQNGAHVTPGYRGLCYLVVKDLHLNDTEYNIPTITMEIVDVVAPEVEATLLFTPNGTEYRIALNPAGSSVIIHSNLHWEKWRLSDGVQEAVQSSASSVYADHACGADGSVYTAESNTGSPAATRLVKRHASTLAVVASSTNYSWNNLGASYGPGVLRASSLSGHPNPWIAWIEKQNGYLEWVLQADLASFTTPRRASPPFDYKFIAMDIPDDKTVRQNWLIALLVKQTADPDSPNPNFPIHQTRLQWYNMDTQLLVTELDITADISAYLGYGPAFLSAKEDSITVLCKNSEGTYKGVTYFFGLSVGMPVVIGPDGTIFIPTAAIIVRRGRTYRNEWGLMPNKGSARAAWQMGSRSYKNYWIAGMDTFIWEFDTWKADVGKHAKPLGEGTTFYPLIESIYCERSGLPYILFEGQSRGPGLYYGFWTVPLTIQRSPVHLGDVILDICAQVGITAAQVDVTDVASLDLWGFCINNRSTGAAALQPLIDVYALDCYESEGKLYFRQRETTPVLTIPESDLGAYLGGPGDEPAKKFSMDQKQDNQIAGIVELNYNDAGTDQEQTMARAFYHGTSSGELLALDCPVLMTAAQAKAAAYHILLHVRQLTQAFQFPVPRKYGRLDPGDIAKVEYAGMSFIIRVEEISYQGGVVLLTCVPSDAPTDYAI